VIIFDASWNPVHDLQSIFRVYRFGQVKPVYIYRFLAQGTMEEKIYHRQVAKQSLALRVIDEHQLDRHFTSTELRELYIFDPDIYDETKPKTVHNLPPDPLLADLLKSCDKWISKYHQHDSLLENRLDEGLNEEERRNAWHEYEQEKQGINLRQEQEMVLRQQYFQQMQQGQLHQQMQQEMAMNAANNHPRLFNMMQNGHDTDLQKMIPNFQQLLANEQFRQQQQQQQQQQLRQQLQNQLMARELEKSVNNKKSKINLISKKR
jgi:transcriptional regulator ATRX